MSKVVTVTPAQVRAARLKVRRLVASGQEVSASLEAIANASPAAASQERTELPAAPGAR